MKLSRLPFQSVLLGGFVSVFSAIFSPHLPAVAQVGVSPLVIEERAVQGRSQGVITLTNSKDKPVRIRIFAEPFTYNVDGFTTLTEAPEDLSDYLQFSPREVVIPAGEEQRIRLLTLFPPNLPTGEYRAVIFAEELTETLDFVDSVAVKVRIGSTIYVQQGELSGELYAVSAEATADQSQIDMLIRNEGLASVRATADWRLHEADREVASGTIPLHTIVAEGERQLSLTLPETLPAGSYILTGNLMWTTLGENNTQSFELPLSVLQ